VSQPLPWLALFDALGEERFAEMRRSLDADNVSPSDRDRFLLNRAVAGVLQDLTPEEGPPDTLVALATLLHCLYQAWRNGWPTVDVDADRLRRALVEPLDVGSPDTAQPFAYYRLPSLLVWASPEPGEPHEPLDGIFVDLAPGRLRALAILGAREGREGFTTMEADVALPLEAPGPREGGAPPFANVIPGGERKGLISLVSTHELAAMAHLVMVSATHAE
jgi:hypothetical protein